MDHDLTSAGWTMDPDDGFVGHVGGIWRREIDGQAQYAFIARQFHANRNGVVHGGMLMTFMDRVLGQTARRTAGAVRGATVNLNSQFLAPAKIDDLVILIPKITSVTSRMVFATGTACVRDVPVVSCQGVYRISRSVI
jgi:acyl-coenzyme A thioesterase PaaI-like protein